MTPRRNLSSSNQRTHLTPTQLNLLKENNLNSLSLSLSLSLCISLTGVISTDPSWHGSQILRSRLADRQKNCAIPRWWRRIAISGSCRLLSSMTELIGPRLYSCCNCRNHVALHDDVISKSFQGRNGRGFLFSHAMNIMVGPKEDRHLMTGLHTVADVYCCDCREVLGWKYERAYEETQKYKEGKFILEKSRIVKENW